MRELRPVLTEHQPVVDHLGQLASERAGDRLLHRQVRAMVAPADHVRDAEPEVVDD
jgi:hypothetical protein